jgi:hypothetical protein
MKTNPSNFSFYGGQENWADIRKKTSALWHA